MESHWDEKLRALIVHRTQDWIVYVTPMIYNDRVLLVSTEEYESMRYPGWVAGWCYDKGPAAMLAAKAWNPDTEDEPVGYKKVAADAR